jgi:hypothetical protein
MELFFEIAGSRDKDVSRHADLPESPIAGSAVSQRGSRIIRNDNHEIIIAVGCRLPAGD